MIRSSNAPSDDRRNRDNLSLGLLLFSDFKTALKFVNAVGKIAEREGHHPDIAIHYNQVVLDLWTHSIGGLSENDFIVAAKIDAMAEPFV